MSGELRDAVLLELRQPRRGRRPRAPRRAAERPASFGDRRAAARAGRARRAGPAGDLLRRGAERRALSPGAARHRGGRPRGRAARLAPRALGRAVGGRGGRAAGAAASRRSRGWASRSRASGRPAASSGRTAIEALAAHGLRWCSPAGEHAGRRAGVAMPALPLARGRRLPPPGVLHRRRLARGDRADVASPHEAADALIGGSTREATHRSCSSCIPSCCSGTRRRRARRVLEHLAGQVAGGAPGGARARARALVELARPPPATALTCRRAPRAPRRRRARRYTSGARTRSNCALRHGSVISRPSGAVPGSWRSKVASSELRTPNTASVSRYWSLSSKTCVMSVW